VASNGKQTLMEEALAASKNGESFNLPGRSDGHVAFLDATLVNGATTVTAKVQHSPDGVNWFDLVSFGALAGVDGNEVVNIAVGVLPQLRANVVLAGGTQIATVKVEVFFRERS